MNFDERNNTRSIINEIQNLIPMVGAGENFVLVDKRSHVVAPRKKTFAVVAVVAVVGYLLGKKS